MGGNPYGVKAMRASSTDVCDSPVTANKRPKRSNQLTDTHDFFAADSPQAPAHTGYGNVPRRKSL
jgi:hypothetical protein